MNKYLDQLINLSLFDTQISEFDPKIETENDKLSLLIKKASKIQDFIDETIKQTDDAKSKITRNDIHLQELKDKLYDIESKGINIKTDKELKALQLEEEIAKEQISFSNEEITRFDNIVETKEIELSKLKEELIVQEEDINNIKFEVDKAIQILTKDRDSISKKREKLLKNFDNKILTFYEKIKKWAKTTAVVPLKRQACSGCFIKINDYMYEEIIKSEDIISCPHCGRIVYKQKNSI